MFFIPKKKEDSGKMVKSALVLSAGAFIAKIIGAFYRVPLTNMLKGEGIGLYQMVFPVYTLLLEFSGAGVPAAISALVSGYRGDAKEEYARRILKNSVRIFAAVGLIGSLFLVLSGRFLAGLQGNADAVYGYMFMSPAVIFVSVISCYRGYFQGLMNMTPTAVSQIAEQVIKLIFGLTFVKIFLPDIPLAVGGATLAVSISEGAALLYVFTVYKLKNGKLPVVTERKTFFSDAKSIISFVIPITLVGVIIPLSHISDSFFIINILNTYTDKATALYGLLSGAASTVINLPVSLLFALAAVALPAVASAKSAEAATEEERRTLYFTLFASVFFAVVCFALAPFAVNILFGSLSDADKSSTVKLIKILSGNIVFLSVLQTVNSIHIARKNPYNRIACIPLAARL